jgi:hypothetical protein
MKINFTLVRVLVYITIALFTMGVMVGVFVLGNNAGYSSGYVNGTKDGHRAGYSQGYSAGHTDGYASGSSAGYSNGYSAGEAVNANQLSDMVDWLTNTCTKYSNGYYQIVMYRDTGGMIHYNCLVSSYP